MYPEYSGCGCGSLSSYRTHPVKHGLVDLVGKTTPLLGQVDMYQKASPSHQIDKRSSVDVIGARVLAVWSTEVLDSFAWVCCPGTGKHTEINDNESLNLKRKVQ